MPQGRIRAIAVGVRSAMAVDWIALTTGIVGVGVAMIALLIILDRDDAGGQLVPLCEDATAGVVSEAPCPE